MQQEQVVQDQQSGTQEFYIKLDKILELLKLHSSQEQLQAFLPRISSHSNQLSLLSREIPALQAEARVSIGKSKEMSGQLKEGQRGLKEQLGKTMRLTQSCKEGKTSLTQKIRMLKQQQSLFGQQAKLQARLSSQLQVLLNSLKHQNDLLLQRSQTLQVLPEADRNSQKEAVLRRGEQLLKLKEELEEKQDMLKSQRRKTEKVGERVKILSELAQKLKQRSRCEDQMLRLQTIRTKELKDKIIQQSLDFRNQTQSVLQLTQRIGRCRQSEKEERLSLRSELAQLKQVLSQDKTKGGIRLAQIIESELLQYLI